MGYQRKRTYLLEFADEEYEGLEIRMRPVTVGEVLDAPDDSNFADMMAELASGLLSWNVEDDAGATLPADIDGIRQLDLEFVGIIYRAYRAAMEGVVSGPKDKPLNSGESYQVASMPMEIMSESHAS